MGRKGNLAVFESTIISETGETMPTKFDVHVFDINPYLHNFLGQFQLIKFFDDHGLYMDYKGNLAVLKVPISPKPKRPCPPKSMNIHVTSMPTCMNFFGQFRSINNVDDHGL